MAVTLPPLDAWHKAQLLKRLREPAYLASVQALFPKQPTPATRLSRLEFQKLSWMLGCGFSQEEHNQLYAFLAERQVVVFDGEGVHVHAGLQPCLDDEPSAGAQTVG
jgi:hypothetical protein